MKLGVFSTFFVNSFECSQKLHLHIKCEILAYATGGYNPKVNPERAYTQKSKDTQLKLRWRR